MRGEAREADVDISSRVEPRLLEILYYGLVTGMVLLVCRIPGAPHSFFCSLNSRTGKKYQFQFQFTIILRLLLTFLSLP